MDAQWPMLVTCIGEGRVPGLQGMDHIRAFLQFFADPARAAELLDIGPPSSRKGWFARVCQALPKVFVEFLDVSRDETHQQLSQPVRTRPFPCFNTLAGGACRDDARWLVAISTGLRLPHLRIRERRTVVQILREAIVRDPPRRRAALDDADPQEDSGVLCVQEFTTVIDEVSLTVGLLLELAGSLGAHMHVVVSGSSNPPSSISKVPAGTPLQAILKTLSVATLSHVDPYALFNIKEEADVRPPDLKLPPKTPSTRFVVEYTRMQLDGVPNCHRGVRPCAERDRKRPLSASIAPDANTIGINGTDINRNPCGVNANSVMPTSPLTIAARPAPRKDVPGAVHLHNRLYQPRKGLFALAVRNGGVNVKEAVEAIRGVFDPGGLAGYGLGHDFPDTTPFDATTVVGEDEAPGDTGDGGEGENKVEVVLVVGECRERALSTVVKLDPLGCQELLQRPTAGEPRFMLEVDQGRRCGEVDDAEVGVGVPLEHGVNGLVESGGVGLVDTARVGPDEFVSEHARGVTELHELGVAMLPRLSALEDEAETSW
ncbi:hypothetical protein OG21DRAFT_1490937 [Imleria badia]|nr:hypothetical protein OG21DRAFT_1490937 [Imleria badia]